MGGAHKRGNVVYRENRRNTDSEIHFSGVESPPRAKRATCRGHPRTSQSNFAPPARPYYLRRNSGRRSLRVLQLLNTGHSGTLSTVHANSAAQGISRFTACVLQSGREMPYRAIKTKIAESLTLRLSYFNR